MGYDRIAYFDHKEANATLLSADKESSRVLYGFSFKRFAGHLGFAVREVVDEADVLACRNAVNRGAQIESLPDTTKAEVIRGRRVAHGLFIELTPPVDEDMTNVLNAYFKTFCEPTDAGMILDYRSEKPRVIDGY